MPPVRMIGKMEYLPRSTTSTQVHEESNPWPFEIRVPHHPSTWSSSHSYRGQLLSSSLLPAGSTIGTTGLISFSGLSWVSFSGLLGSCFTTCPSGAVPVGPGAQEAAAMRSSKGWAGQAMLARTIGRARLARRFGDRAWTQKALQHARWYERGLLVLHFWRKSSEDPMHSSTIIGNMTVI